MPSGLPANSLEQQQEITRRRFLGTATLAGMGVAAYAAMHGRHELDYVRNALPIRDLPDAFRGFRIVQISDIHLEEFTEPWFLHRVVAGINRLQPDMVLLTGDFISRGPLGPEVPFRAMPVCAEALSRLTCPLRYAVLGNHDVSVDGPMVIRRLAERGIPTLYNSHVAIDRGGDRLWIAGVDDPGTSDPDLTAAVPAQPAAPVLLMAHEPDFADTVRLHPRAPLIDVMLSGHTHGGQVRLPLVGPLVLPPMGRMYVHGRYQLGSMQLYVNRGIGTVGLPFRLNCTSEITEHTLQRA